ncbi:cell division protein FtsQ [Veronia nyctiphanis]|uniref:Cell division protein FtsQ n=1 Tax=Veronia nyctiphanis TaxID=1278244 RepID=A0A4Q0YNM9_9GAMM|nr:cell division protein FtsQ/DivIB [Veronia nyctiphanis]RXJ72476.1 cell division protein FtsQ [Veronia nyctiphanis]
MTSVIAEETIELPQNAKPDWGGLLFLIAVISFFFWGLIQVLNWMSDETQLPLSKMVIHGELNHLTPEEVRAALVAKGHLHSFMLQDVDQLHDAIITLPWAERVTVRKQWPDMLSVHIVEHAVAAIWNSRQLLNVSGIVFKANPTDVEGQKLVSLHGPEGSEREVLEAWRQMNNILAPAGIHIAALALNERQSWRIVTYDGFRIELGRRDKQERLLRLIALLPQIEQSTKKLEYVDLRYDTGAAVGWKNNRDQNESEQ